MNKSEKETNVDSFIECIPTSPNSKPKQSRQVKLDKLVNSMPVPSTFGATFIHMLRRYLAGKTAGNPIEESYFQYLKKLSPELQELLKCTLKSFDSLKPEEQKVLFNSDLLQGSIDHANSMTQIRNGFAQEIVDIGSPHILDTLGCTLEERPGLVRTQPLPGSEMPPSQVLICSINGSTTGPYEIEIGQTVNLEGMNFSSVDTKVKLTDMNGNARQMDAFVCGDEETPLTESINGTESPIIDCRVHDRIAFRIPDDMLTGQYSLQLIVPNPNHVGGWTDPLNSDGITIQIVVPLSARFEIAAEKLHCKKETSPAWIGSDEVAITFYWVSSLPPIGDKKLDTARQTVRFSDVDTGDDRVMNNVLYSPLSPTDAIGLHIVGLEIDNEEAYEIGISEYSHFFNYFIERMIEEHKQIQDEIDELNHPLGGFIVGVIVELLFCIVFIIGVLVAIFYSLWAPTDLIINDTFSVSAADLIQLTNANIPLPEPTEYDYRLSIKVKVTPVEKNNNQYWELREYISDDEDSSYQILLRYTRVA